MNYCVKCPNTEFFLVRIFLYSVWIQENKEKKKTLYLDTFHALNFRGTWQLIPSNFLVLNILLLNGLLIFATSENFIYKPNKRKKKIFFSLSKAFSWLLIHI